MKHELPDDETAFFETLEHVPAEAFGVPAPNPAFRDSLLAKTTGRVRRAPLRRRAMLVGAVAAAYALGLATTWLALLPQKTRKDTPPTMAQAQTSDATVEPVIDVLLVSPQLGKAQAPDWEMLARRLAAADKHERVGVLRNAGDQYLDAGDPERATQCYGRLLDLLAKEDGLRMAHEDNWLLASLKLARQGTPNPNPEESNHVPSNS